MLPCVARKSNNISDRKTYLLDNRTELSHSFLRLLRQPSTGTKINITLIVDVGTTRVLSLLNCNRLGGNSTENTRN